MSKDALRIEGLKEFNKALKDVDKNLPKAVRLALNEAADMVVDTAQSKVPRRSGRARKSLKAKSTRTLVRVGGGGGKAVYYGWLDFGGRVGKSKSVRRPFKKKGRYLYPSYFKHRDSGDIQRKMLDALTDVARKAGMDVD